MTRDTVGLTLTDMGGVIEDPPFIVVYAAIGFGKCLASGTLIPLTDGRVCPIEQISVGDPIFSLDPNLQFRSVRVARTAETGVKPIVEVRTRTTVIRCTPDHPLLAGTKWIPAGELRPKDLIAVPRALPVSASEDAPEHLVKFLAYWIANGCSSARAFSSTNPTIIEDFAKVIESFGWRACSSDGKNWRITGSQTVGPRPGPFTRLLEKYGLRGARAADKRIPDFIFQLRRPLVALFLNRYLGCDGSVEPSRRYPTVSFCTASEMLMRQMTCLLRRFGVWGATYKKYVKGRPYWEWIVSATDPIEALRREIGVFTKPILVNHRSRADNNDRLPFSRRELLGDLRRLQLGNIPKSKISRSLAQSYADVGDIVHRYAHSGVYWDEVKSVTAVGTAPVYDLEIPGLHNFVAENCVVHNSTSLATSFAGVVGGPGALFLTTSPAVLRPYASWCELNREIVEDKKLRTLLKPNPRWTKAKAETEPAYLNQARAWDEGGAAVKVIPAYQTDGKTRVDNCDLIREVLERFCASRQRGDCPYNGFVLDEGSELGDRWLEAIDCRFAKEIERNAFRRWGIVDSWFTWLKNVPRAAGCFLAMACHVEDPKYFTEIDKQPMRMGQLKAPGGPAMPGIKTREALCAAADIVLRGELRSTGVLGGGDGVERLWITQPSPLWMSKFRSFNVAQEERRPIRALLEAAGYRLG